MSGRPVAGTYRLDGMLQGPFPPNPELASDIGDWVNSAKAAGFHFHLSLDGGTFSLVADSTPQKTSRLKGNDLCDALEEGLNSLLGLLPKSVCSGVFSTIRSEEFRDGRAVQALYAVGMDGQVSSEQRTVDASTEEAAPEINLAALRRAVLPAFTALLLILFVSSFFIDYRKLFLSARDRLAPLSKGELVIGREFTEDYLTFDVSSIDNRRNILVFHLSRGSAWAGAMESKPGDVAEGDWSEFATLLAIHRGVFRIDFYDKERKLLATREIDTRELLRNESMDVAIVWNREERIASAILRP